MSFVFTSLKTFFPTATTADVSDSAPALSVFPPIPKASVIITDMLRFIRLPPLNFRHCHLAEPDGKRKPGEPLTSQMWISSILESFQFVERARPVVVQQARKSAIGEQPATGLARRTVVSLVAGIADALDPGPAAWARFAIAAVDRHLMPKCGNLLGKSSGRLRPQAIGPFEQRRAGRLI